MRYPADATYEGYLTKGNGNNVYVQIALHADSYELFRKPVAEGTAQLIYGKIESFANGKIHLDNGEEFQLITDTLISEGARLHRLSAEGHIPGLYTRQYLKNNENGQDAILRLYTQSGKPCADFRFMEQDYQLPYADSNGTSGVYSDGIRTLHLVPELAQDALFGNVVLKDSSQAIYTFTPLTPSTKVYESQSRQGGPTVIEAIYYNDGTRAQVRILSDDATCCYLLNQTDASAKTAEYSDGKVQWSVGNHGNATLVKEGCSYAYQTRQ